jgi:cytochrome c5
MAWSFATVGFGVAAVAALVLASMGHPPMSGPPVVVAAAAPSAASNAPRSFVLKSVKVDLPASDAAFPGPAKTDVIAGNCLSCHSAGMVMNQPPLSKAAWMGIVEKMIHSYKAPVDEGEASAIVDYLQATKGAKTP